MPRWLLKMIRISNLINSLKGERKGSNMLLRAHSLVIVGKLQLYINKPYNSMKKGQRSELLLIVLFKCTNLKMRWNSFQKNQKKSRHSQGDSLRKYPIRRRKKVVRECSLRHQILDLSITRRRRTSYLRWRWSSSSSCQIS